MDDDLTAREMWALGDYHRFARELVWELGPVLVDACAIGPGQRVLDVAAGTGNVALRAAEAGADVVASDLVPEHFAAGRREARRLGVELRWVEADAQALPFADAEFDVVTSSFGAIFAPDHRRVASELLRVCRPGGTVGMINFTPDGCAADFFAALAPYLPPPPEPPLLWGSEAHVRDLFGDAVVTVEARDYVERAASARAYADFCLETFGPAVAIARQPGSAAAFERDLLAFATRANQSADGGPAGYRYAYLLVLARKRDPQLA